MSEAAQASWVGSCVQGVYILDVVRWGRKLIRKIIICIQII